jgi:hypothetical protein
MLRYESVAYNARSLPPHLSKRRHLVGYRRDRRCPRQPYHIPIADRRNADAANRTNYMIENSDPAQVPPQRVIIDVRSDVDDQSWTVAELKAARVSESRLDGNRGLALIGTVILNGLMVTLELNKATWQPCASSWASASDRRAEDDEERDIAKRPLTAAATDEPARALKIHKQGSGPAHSCPPAQCVNCSHPTVGPAAIATPHLDTSVARGHLAAPSSHRQGASVVDLCSDDDEDVKPDRLAGLPSRLGSSSERPSTRATSAQRRGTKSCLSSRSTKNVPVYRCRQHLDALPAYVDHMQ